MEAAIRLDLVMTRVSLLDSQETIDLQAGEWLVRLDSEDATSDIREEFEQWLAGDPRRRKAVERLERQLARFDGIDRALAPFTAGAPDPDIVAKWRRRARMPQLSLTWAGAAAAGLLIGWLVLATLPSTQNYVTAKGERETLTLSDATVVELKTDSAVAVRFTDHERRLELRRGEAHFEVMHDPQRPFVVVAGDSQVRAIGTAFNVRLQAGTLEVTVTAGLVEVVPITSDRVQAEGPDRRTVEPIAVSVGHKAEFSDRLAGMKALGAEAIERELAWRDGMLIFRGETLEAAVEEISRYTDKRIVIADPSIRDLKVGGYFKTDNADRIVEMVASALSLQVRPLNRNAVALVKAEPSSGG